MSTFNWWIVVLPLMLLACAVIGAFQNRRHYCVIVRPRYGLRVMLVVSVLVAIVFGAMLAIESFSGIVQLSLDFFGTRVDNYGGVGGAELTVAVIIWLVSSVLSFFFATVAYCVGARLGKCIILRRCRQQRRLCHNIRNAQCCPRFRRNNCPDGIQFSAEDLSQVPSMRASIESVRKNMSLRDEKVREIQVPFAVRVYNPNTGDIAFSVPWKGQLIPLPFGKHRVYPRQDIAQFLQSEAEPAPVRTVVNQLTVYVEQVDGRRSMAVSGKRHVIDGK